MFYVGDRTYVGISNIPVLLISAGELFLWKQIEQVSSRMSNNSFYDYHEVASLVPMYQKYQ